MLYSRGTLLTFCYPVRSFVNKLVIVQVLTFLPMKLEIHEFQVRITEGTHLFHAVSRPSTTIVTLFFELKTCVPA